MFVVFVLSDFKGNSVSILFQNIVCFDIWSNLVIFGLLEPLLRASDIDKEREMWIPPILRVGWFKRVWIYSRGIWHLFWSIIVKHLLPLISMSDSCVSLDSGKVIKLAWIIRFKTFPWILWSHRHTVLVCNIPMLCVMCAHVMFNMGTVHRSRNYMFIMNQPNMNQPFFIHLFYKIKQFSYKWKHQLLISKFHWNGLCLFGFL